MASRPGIKRVWINMELARVSQRDILFGISNWARRNAPWSISIANGEREKEVLAVAGSERPDGIITTLQLAPQLADSSIPLVVIGGREPWLGRRMLNLAFVRNDDQAIGKAAARKFLSTRLYASFGFVGSHIRTYCPLLREEGFHAEIKRVVRRDYRVYDQGEKYDGTSEELATLGEWLEALPKPAAILAVHDLRATHVIAAANERGLAIPGDVSVIGVDNDELLCEFTNPPLTSIAPDHVQTGELAAAALAEIFDGGRRTRVPPVRKARSFEIVERETTSSHTPSEHLAKEAMAFIRQNFKSGIRAEDVVRSVPGRSRRLVDKRFREIYGCPIHEAILRVRYGELKRRLVRSKASIGELMKSLGFSDFANAKRLFKSRYGMTMREWRSRPQGTT